MNVPGTFALAAALCVAATACDNGSNATTPGGEAAFQIVLAPQGGSASAPAVSALQRSLGPLRATVSLDAVESIVLPIGQVEAQAADSTWVDAGSVNADIDLMALPADGIVIVDGSLPEGSYAKLRFHLTADPTITLSQDLTVGRSTFTAGTHTLVIPSVDQSGFILNAGFTVGSNGQDLTVLFDDNATVKKVIATGSGRLMIAPVLTVRNTQGDDVGGFDDEGANGDHSGETHFQGRLTAVNGDVLTLGDGTLVQVSSDTRVDGDLLLLTDAEAALTAGADVEADGWGTLASDGTTIVANSLTFDVTGEGTGG